MKRLTPILQSGRELPWYFEPEALLWLGALVLLASADPFGENHFSLFLPAYLFGWESPGYNLGHAIAQLFHGEFTMSFQSHPLGIPAVLILSGRSLFLFYRRWQKK